jgi:hypothetical protein
MKVAILGSLLVTILFFFGALLNTVFGGIVGWVVNIMFPFVTATLNGLAGTELSGFEAGAVLGFFGSFFRSNLNTNK